MKRLVISLVMLVLIIGFSVANTLTLYRVRNELSNYLNVMEQKVEAEGAQAVVEDAADFQKLWLEREDRLTRFIRHSDLEQITWDSARLPYLAKYGDIGELSAEISRVRLQINHLWETQVPRWRTVL